jgi:hypothetical protein
MSHICVNMICLPSGKFIVRGFLATHLLTMSRPSMMNMDVAPVSATAWFVAMVNAFKHCGIVIGHGIGRKVIPAKMA